MAGLKGYGKRAALCAFRRPAVARRAAARSSSSPLCCWTSRFSSRLDKKMREQMQVELIKLHARSASPVLVTHDQEECW
ncbi:MAG: hypothetical protein R3D53_07605 [Paracoccaceae bacterium]